MVEANRKNGGKRGLPLVVDGKKSLKSIQPMKMTNKQPAMRFIPKNNEKNKSKSNLGKALGGFFNFFFSIESLLEKKNENFEIDHVMGHVIRNFQINLQNIF